MRLVRIVGADEAAHAALVTRLVGALSGRGRTVSVIARVAPDFEFDRPGKDGHRHRAAGARDVALIGPTRYAVIHEAPPREAAPALDALLARLGPADIVLAVGFDEPRGEVLRLHDNALELSSGRRFARNALDELASCLAGAS